MKITTKDDWQFSVDVFQTAKGPEARITDGRLSLVGGENDKAQIAALADKLIAAAERLKSDATGKPS